MGRLKRGAPLPAGDEKARAVRRMFDAIADRYDVLNRIISLGLDVGWRRRAVATLGLPVPSRVLDLACGTGDLCRELARAGHRPVGIDFAWEMLARARTSAPLAQADALRLPIADGAADGVTCGFALRNVVDLAALFGEIGRVVRPGGRIALLEVSEPRGALMRVGHGVYFNRVVPLVGGLLSDRDAYAYLPRSVAYLPPPHQMLGLLRDAGFRGVDRIMLTGGIAQILIGERED